jgi:hypothetical protein
MPSRKVRLYALHGRTGTQLLDYPDFFRWLRQLPTVDTRLNIWDDLVFVIESTDTHGSSTTFNLISGDPSENALLYNDSTGQLEIGDDEADAWPASRTRVVVDAGRRLLALEIRRSGVSDRNLERYFEHLARDRGYVNDLALSLSPVPSDTFEEEVKRLERIRGASIVMLQPNVDWTDSPDVLSSLASSSNGARAEATVTARRNQSLSTDEGIIPIIFEQTSNNLPSVVKATVTGRMPGDDADTTISTEKHPRQTAVKIPKRASAVAIKNRVVEAARNLIRNGEAGSDDPETDVA